MGSVITKLRIKKSDNTFDEKDIGVWSDNVKCKIPTGEEGKYTTTSLTEELATVNNNILNYVEFTTIADNGQSAFLELNEDKKIVFIAIQFRLLTGELTALGIINAENGTYVYGTVQHKTYDDNSTPKIVRYFSNIKVNIETIIDSMLGSDEETITKNISINLLTSRSCENYVSSSAIACSSDGYPAMKINKAYALIKG